MRKISPSFYRSDFTCHCGCGMDVMDFELVVVLERLYRKYRRKITITSGCRCPKHNSTIPNAAKNSYHTKGKAVDFFIEDTDMNEVYEYLTKRYNDRYGIGNYKNRIHIDMRTNSYRWHV
jgi:uncharacterized protein YcbK (DUF882 family)